MLLFPWPSKLFFGSTRIKVKLLAAKKRRPTIKQLPSYLPPGLLDHGPPVPSPCSAYLASTLNLARTALLPGQHLAAFTPSG